MSWWQRRETAANKDALHEISAFLGSLSEDMADCSAAAMGSVEAGEAIAASVQQINEAMAEIRGFCGDLADEQRRQNAQINRYIADQAKGEGDMARLRSEVREIKRSSGG